MIHTNAFFIMVLKRSVLFRKKNFDFFQERTVVLGNFESYLSLLKSPESMALIVSKHVYTLTSGVLSRSAASTKLLFLTKFIFCFPTS